MVGSTGRTGVSRQRTLNKVVGSRGVAEDEERSVWLEGHVGTCTQRGSVKILSRGADRAAGADRDWHRPPLPALGSLEDGVGEGSVVLGSAG